MPYGLGNEIQPSDNAEEHSDHESGRRRSQPAVSQVTEPAAETEGAYERVAGRRRGTRLLEARVEGPKCPEPRRSALVAHGQRFLPRYVRPQRVLGRPADPTKYATPCELVH